MYCSSCGKQIPDESTFCMHCGKRISKHRRVSENPPIAIEKIYLTKEGPTDVKSKGGFFSNAVIGRGFSVSVSLIDSSNKSTISDGELIIGLIVALHDLHKQLGANPRALQEAKQKALLYKEIIVKKVDFTWETLKYASGNEEVLCYRYTQLTPLVYFATSNERVYLHVWFRTPDGKLFYKTGDWVKWE